MISKILNKISKIIIGTLKVIGILFLIMIVMGAIDSIPDYLPNRMFCRSGEGRITIIHNGSQITRVRDNDYWGSFNMHQARNRVDEIGLDAFLDEFAYEFEHGFKFGECKKMVFYSFELYLSFAVLIAFLIIVFSSLSVKLRGQSRNSCN